jgi:putative DNA primase/helicase
VILEAAANYIANGIPVFPAKDKKPLVEHGYLDASLDLAQAAEWWDKFPSAQIGIPTGRVSGIFALDLDSAAAIALAETWNLPDTKTVETRPGRIQKWFSHPPEAESKCTASVIAPDVDTRGTGGYVIAPPSIHNETRTRYRFIRDVPLADVPLFLLNPSKPNGRGSARDVSAGIPAGRRHQTLLSFAGSMRARGCSQEEITAALAVMNQQKCNAPLEPTELEKLSRWAATKNPGGGITMPITSSRIELRTYDEIVEEKVEWLWKPVLARKKVNILSGTAGLGKSLVSLDIAARISTGDEMPDGTPGIRGAVVILSAEDAANDTIKPRLRVAGADMKRVYEVQSVRRELADGTAKETQFDLSRDIENLAALFAAQPEIVLTIIDPMSAFLGSSVDSWKDSSVRGVLGPLSKLAETSGVCIAAILHPNKSQSGTALEKLISGSGAFGNAARSVWGFVEDEGIPGRMIMCSVKPNLAERGTAFAYSIDVRDDVPFAVWEGYSFKMNAESVLGGRRADQEEKSRLRETEEFLAQLLDNGPMLVAEIRVQAKDAGFGWRSVERAKVLLGIKAKRTAHLGPWTWSKR